MKLITARELPTEYLFRVHLDEAKVDTKGDPEPAHVQEFRFGLEPPLGQTKTQYLANIKSEVKLLCQLEVAPAPTGIKLAEEGQAL